MIRSLFASLILISATVHAQDAEPVAANPQVELSTRLGTIVIELDAARAPISTENFLAYARSGNYDGTVFHRVIETFMIQGGGYDTEMKERPTPDPIRNEGDNGLSNVRGSVAMARTGDPHSARNQFFINVVDNPRLNHVPGDEGEEPINWGYAVFGTVIEGMDVVDEIRVVPTGTYPPFFNDVPLQPIVIDSVRVIGDPEDASDETMDSDNEEDNGEDNDS